jgi:Tfp pilus assembly protein PilF
MDAIETLCSRLSTSDMLDDLRPSLTGDDERGDDVRSAWLTLVLRLANTDQLEAAIHNAQLLPPGPERVAALAFIALQHADRGELEAARNHLTAAVQENQCPGKVERAIILAGIYPSLVDRDDQLKRIMSRAMVLSAIEQVSDHVSRILLTLDVDAPETAEDASALVAAEDSALQQMRQIADLVTRDDALSQLVQRLMSRGNVDLALEASEEITDPAVRDAALSGICVALVRLGGDEVAGTRAIDKAVETAGHIAALSTWVRTSIEIAGAVWDAFGPDGLGEELFIAAVATVAVPAGDARNMAQTAIAGNASSQQRVLELLPDLEVRYAAARALGRLHGYVLSTNLPALQDLAGFWLGELDRGELVPAGGTIEPGHEIAYRELRRIADIQGELWGEAAALVGMALEQQDLGAYEYAARLFTRAIEIDNRNPPYRDRGVAYWYSGRLDEALADLDREAARKKELSFDLLSARGQVLAEKGEFERAAQDLRSALEFKEEGGVARAYARNGLGLALAGLGHYPQAFKEFDASLRAASHNAWAYYNRALAHEWAGQPDKAANDYERALDEKDPSLPPHKRHAAKEALSRLRGPAA